jgi:hypothetical protein
MATRLRPGRSRVGIRAGTRDFISSQNTPSRQWLLRFFVWSKAAGA